MGFNLNSFWPFIFLELFRIVPKNDFPDAKAGSCRILEYLVSALEQANGMSLLEEIREASCSTKSNSQQHQRHHLQQQQHQTDPQPNFNKQTSRSTPNLDAQALPQLRYCSSPNSFAYQKVSTPGKLFNPVLANFIRGRSLSIEFLASMRFWEGSVENIRHYECLLRLNDSRSYQRINNVWSRPSEDNYNPSLEVSI